MTVWMKHPCPKCGRPCLLRICQSCDEERCSECLPKHEKSHQKNN